MRVCVCCLGCFVFIRFSVCEVSEATWTLSLNSLCHFTCFIIVTSILCLLCIVTSFESFGLFQSFGSFGSFGSLGSFRSMFRSFGPCRFVRLCRRSQHAIIPFKQTNKHTHTHTRARTRRFLGIFIGWLSMIR